VFPVVVAGWRRPQKSHHLGVAVQVEQPVDIVSGKSAQGQPGRVQVITAVGHSCYSYGMMDT
jgi:hypothetical protein